MKFIAEAIALLVTVTTVTAGPIATGLVKRNPPGKCGNHQYSNAEAQAAYDEATFHLQNRPITTVKGRPNSQGVQREYPGYFGNGEAISGPSECSGANLLDLQEFPILRDGTLFNTDGQDQGPDRVVLARITDGTLVQCWIMTHEGAPTANGFVKCE